MNCSKCGEEIPEDVAFCPWCGTKTENIENEQEKAQEPKKKVVRVKVLKKPKTDRKKKKISRAVRRLIRLAVFAGLVFLGWHFFTKTDTDKLTVIPGKRSGSSKRNKQRKIKIARFVLGALLKMLGGQD